MHAFPFADFLVLLFGVLGFIPTLLEARESRTSRLFFYGFIATIIGIILLMYGLITDHATAIAFSHVIGIMIPGILFMTWAERNYNEQSFIRKRMEKFSRGDE